MEYVLILQQVFQVCIIPLLGVLTGIAIRFINAKANEIIARTDNEIAIKYIDKINATITECVIATNQTYVDSLKDKDAFDAAAQKEAFQKTFDAVKAILTQDALDYLNTAYGDATLYITQKIEATVKAEKSV